MVDTLQQLGFTPKEAKVYLLIIENEAKTAADIAKLSGEKRANTYMILESLAAKKVIIPNDDTPVRTFSAKNPKVALRGLMEEALERQKQVQAALESALPNLNSRYTLANNRPGVTHMHGAEGFLTLLRDMTTSKTEVQLIASNRLPSDPAVLKEFRQLLLKRRNAGIKTRAIFHEDNNTPIQKELFARRGIEMRVLGEKEFDGEVVIYENNVAFTVYEPTLLVTVISNGAITETMNTLFEELWAKAKP
jgi:sugar-specific transcriptional regulator TrmB